MFHYWMAQRLARKIYRQKRKLEKHMAQHYGYMLDRSCRVGYKAKYEGYIEDIMRL